MKLEQLFESKIYKPPIPKKKTDRGKLVFFIYKHLLHGNDVWMIKENRWTIHIYLTGFKNFFAANNSNFRRFIHQGEMEGLWVVKKYVRGYMTLELPLIKEWYVNEAEEPLNEIGE